MKVNVTDMHRACLEAAPMEACGVVLHDGTVLRVTNVAERPGIFIMDTEELIAIYEEHGDIDGVWHSHPEGDPSPSESDLEIHPPGKMIFIATPAGVVYHGRPGQATLNLIPEGSGSVGETAPLRA